MGKNLDNLIGAGLRQIVSSVPAGFVVVVPDKTAFVNPETCKTTGYEADELIGKEQSVLFPSRDEQDRVTNGKNAKIAAAGSALLRTVRKTKKGELLAIDMHNKPIDGEDTSKGFSFTAIDVSRQRRRENHLQQASADAKESDRQKAVMLLNMSHEFSAPMNGILGLTICSKMTIMMDGSIKVKSALRHGSTFTLRLPVEIASEKKQAADNMRTRRTPLILLVVDNPSNQEITNLLLNPDYEVTIARRSERAVAQAKETAYDLVLIDINLGGKFDGIETALEISKIKGYAGVPVIVLTGYVTQSGKKEFFKNGPNDFLPKPFFRQQLRETVEESLSQVN